MNTRRFLDGKAKKIIACVAIIAAIFALCIAMTGCSDDKINVKLEVKCTELTDDMSVLTDNSLKDTLPADGEIIAEKTYKMEEGDDVMDLLEDACEEEKIQLDIKDSSYGEYVDGIANLYPSSVNTGLSGWMFTVDGETPNTGADEVELTDGMTVVWYYTVDYTK